VTLGIGCSAKPDAFDPCVPIPGSNGSAASQAGISTYVWLFEAIAREQHRCRESPTGFEKRREIAALLQLGDAQLQCGERSVEGAVAAAVAPSGALAAALIPPRSLSISNCSTASATFAENLHRRPSPAIRPTPISLRSSGPLACFRLKFGNSTLADLARWPPQRDRSSTLRVDPEIPPPARTLTRLGRPPVTLV